MSVCVVDDTSVCVCVCVCVCVGRLGEEYVGVRGRWARGMFSAGIIYIMDYFLIQYVCLLSV